MPLLQVETADVLTPIVAMASSFMAAIVTLAVAVFRFGLGRSESNPSTITKQNLDDAVRTVCDMFKTEITAVRQEVTYNGRVLAEIRGRLRNPDGEPK